MAQMPPDEAAYAGHPSAGATLLSRNWPARGWYWVSIGVLLAGVVWFAVAFAVLLGRVNSFPRVPDPGTGVLTLHAGEYVVYYEGPIPEVPSGFVKVTPLSPAAAVGSISAYSGGLTYQFGSRTGNAVAVLQITRPGRFLIRATGAPGVPAGHLVFGPSITGWIVIAGLPAGVLGLAGVAGVVTVAILRNRRASPARASPVRG